MKLLSKWGKIMKIKEEIKLAINFLEMEIQKNKHKNKPNSIMRIWLKLLKNLITINLPIFRI